MKLTWLVNNISIKIISLVLALIVWFYIGDIIGENPFLVRPKVVSTNFISSYIPVEPRFTGILSEGYTLNRDKIKVEPSKILIIGDRKILEQLSKIYTVPIDISGISKTKDVVAELEVLGQELEFKEAVVKVTVSVERVK